MPLSDINTLYKIAEEREKSKQSKEQHDAEVLEDEMEEAVT
jgi:hypothetical protein